MILCSKNKKRKLLILAFLFSAAGPAIAEDNSVLAASQAPTERYQHIAYVDPANYSVIERYALDARPKFTADPALYSEIKPTGLAESRAIDDWRERVFKQLTMYSGPRQPDLANGDRFPSENDLDEQANERRMVRKLVTKETLKFTQERVPEIDRLVKALRFEVSNRTYRENAEAEANDVKTGEARSAGKNIVKDKLSLRTGMRVQVEDGNLGLVSETEARYSKLSSFYKVNLDRHNDNSLGLMYALGRNLNLQAAREVTRATDPLTREKTNEKSSLNLIQVVYKF